MADQLLCAKSLDWEALVTEVLTLVTLASALSPDAHQHNQYINALSNKLEMITKNLLKYCINLFIIYWDYRDDE